MEWTTVGARTAVGQSPSFDAVLSRNSSPSRMYPRIDELDFHRPSCIIRNSGTRG
jgi:hypothetical protein